MFIALFLVRLLLPVLVVVMVVLHFAGATNIPMIVVIFGILALSFLNILLPLVRPSLDEQHSEIKLVELVMKAGSVTDSEWGDSRKIVILSIIFLLMIGAIYMGARA